MARLIHLNGVPGSGKSTLAARYAEEHPGTLCCEIDVLRSMIGGWREDFENAGHTIRPAATAFVDAYLAGGGDVVVPQLIADEAELVRFARGAAEVGAGHVHVLLDLTAAEARRRFHVRTGAWADETRRIVEAAGGDEVLDTFHRRLRQLTDRPDTVVVPADGDLDTTYAALLAALS